MNLKILNSYLVTDKKSSQTYDMDESFLRYEQVFVASSKSWPVDLSH